MIRGVVPVLVASFTLAALGACALGLSACTRGGAARLEGRWKGKVAEGVAPEAQSAANAFAAETEIDVRGDEITVTTAHDKQTGTYKVVRDDKAQVTIVTDKDEPSDTQTFTLVDDKTLKWNVLDGKSITFVRAK